MMSSFSSVNLAGQLQAGFSPDVLLEALSRQMSAAVSRQSSRGIQGHRSGNAMRIVKPRSANNSPGSTIQARRRTYMNDGLVARPSQQILEQAYLPTPASETPTDYYHPAAARRTSRPLSWHPSSLASRQMPIQQQPSAMGQYSFPLSQSDADMMMQYWQQLPPTPAAYSTYNSPSLAFSPAPLSYPTINPSQYFAPSGWSPAEQMGNAPPSPSNCPGLMDCSSHQPAQPSPPMAQPPTECWGSDLHAAAQGFARPTAPPTPDDYPSAQQSQPTLSPEEAIPYQPLEEDDSDGEVLVGMGLYDPPEKANMDLQLDNYRFSTSHLLGASYRHESEGKGLMLEDAWEPPASSEEDDGEEDAEGEDQDADEED